MAKYLIVVSFFCFFAFLAKASDHSKKSDKVYVLKGPETPVKIEEARDVSSEDLVMRDPNLGSAKKESSMPAKVDIGKAHKPIKASVKNQSKKLAGTQFKPMKVTATARLPRVAFSKMVLPVGVREESKTSDFVNRSLEKMP